MVSQELIEMIEEKFRKGESHAEIRDSLERLGFDIGDINEAISTIQRNAIKQLPIVSKIYHYFDKLEQKTSNASTKLVIGILIGSFLLVGIISVMLYFFFDPLNSKANERDTEREKDFITLRVAVERFHKEKGYYPAALTHLVPIYIPAIPLDPKTGAQYKYAATKQNFELCVTFETKTSQCLSTGSETKSIIPQVDSNSL